jgi:hypothetical protein
MKMVNSAAAQIRGPAAEWRIYMIIKYAALLLLLLLYIGIAAYIHRKRTGNSRCESYRRFARILK